MFSAIEAIRRRDPASQSTVEILLCYPGLHALILHRINDVLHKKLKIPVFPRLISHLGRFITGIEIHPGAQIGKNFFIDHGMGVVIGETAEIGDNVTLYQGVTLGGTSSERVKRHPTLKDNVTVGAGANVLGAITIGENSRIGAGSVVVHDVPPNSSVVGVPGRAVAIDGKKISSGRLDHGSLPDPIREQLEKLQHMIEEHEEKTKNKQNVRAEKSDLSNTKT